ncbi:uncharacterized protein [Rutidosis leptorrhynchoides]|uniref:uncharacterized protein n=1 Tax=Rutidosis leptorrhynchoides TaxID=125765 RepID=UPI003A990D8C
MHNRICKLPDYQISFPQLEATYLNDNDLRSIPDEFIEGIKNTRVLNLASNMISFLPQSLMGLTQLCMLNLSKNRSLCEVSILGELKYLEILILNKTGIKEVPESIGQLVNLRRLELKDCKELCYTTPGVILKLSRLEELCIEFVVPSIGIHKCLDEVMCLSKLTCLRLKAPSVYDIPQDFKFDKLKGFNIRIQKEYKMYYMWNPERHLTLCTDYLVFPFLKWMKRLIEVKRPNTSLFNIKNLNNIVPDLYQEGFNNLEGIALMECPNITCLVDTCDLEGNTNEKFLMEFKHLVLSGLYNLKVLWKCPDEFISLTNLVNLYIIGCDKLVRLFPMSVAKGLVSLKEVRIRLCENLEEVIWGETEMDEVIVFPCLTTIGLRGCYKLKSFYSGSCSIKYPSLVKVSPVHCPNMEMWGHGSHETPKLKFVNNVPLDGPYSINDAIVKVRVQKTYPGGRAPPLGYIKIRPCLVDTCDLEGNTNEKFLMEFKHLVLSGLYNLKVLWKCPNQFISLTNLIHLHIEYCHKLVRLFPLSIAQGLVSMKELKIKGCDGLEEMIWGETEMAANIVVFPCLTSIELRYLYKFKSFYSGGNCTIKYPSLVEVTVRGCLNMEMWGPGTHETPKLKFVDGEPLDGPYSINDAVIKSVEKYKEEKYKREQWMIANKENEKKCKQEHIEKKITNTR